jgi:hypothetical protein
VGAIKKTLAFIAPFRKGVLISRICVAKNAWEKPYDCIYKKQGREFSTTEHIITCAQFEWIESFNNSFVDPFVVASDEKQILFGGQLFNTFLFQDFALRREMNSNGRTCKLSLNLLHCVVQWLAHHHHSWSTAKRAVIDLSVLIVSPIADVVNMYLDVTAILCSFDDTCCECCFKHLWKECKNVDPH